MNKDYYIGVALHPVEGKWAVAIYVQTCDSLEAAKEKAEELAPKIEAAVEALLR